MSRTPYFFIEKYDYKKDKYELQHPYVWNDAGTELEPADLYPYNGSHDLFSIVENKSSIFPTLYGIHNGIPKDTCEIIKKWYEKCCYISDWDEKTVVKPTVRWFTYADMYIYCLEHPQEIDYDAMDAYDSNEKIMRQNSLFSLKERVDAFLEVVSPFFWKDEYSQLRIVYWIM